MKRRQKTLSKSSESNWTKLDKKIATVCVLLEIGKSDTSKIRRKAGNYCEQGKSINHNDQLEILENALEYINNNEFCAILIGGSLMMDSHYNDRLEIIKNNTSLPLISFPSSMAQINKSFDAILFTSLIKSTI